MRLLEQLRAIPARSLHQLRLTTRMKRQIRRNIIHLTLIRAPRRLAFPARLRAQL